MVALVRRLVLGLLLGGVLFAGGASPAPVAAQSSCDESYPDFCVAPTWEVGDLDCADIASGWFTVYPPDPHGIDDDADGYGCEGNAGDGTGELSGTQGIVTSYEEPVTEGGALVWDAQALDDTVILSGPGGQYGILAVAPVGSLMRVQGDPGDGYYPVTYEGMTGWASVGLLQGIDSGSSGSEAPIYEEPVPMTAECDPSYPDLCVPPGSADLNCDYVYGLSLSAITVYPPDPHGFDGNGDVVGCEG